MLCFKGADLPPSLRSTYRRRTLLRYKVAQEDQAALLLTDRPASIRGSAIRKDSTNEYGAERYLSHFLGGQPCQADWIITASSWCRWPSAGGGVPRSDICRVQTCQPLRQLARAIIWRPPPTRFSLPPPFRPSYGRSLRKSRDISQGIDRHRPPRKSDGAEKYNLPEPAPASEAIAPEWQYVFNGRT